MSTLQLKNDLHRMVVETDDPTILQQISVLFATLRKEKDWWDLISEQEKRRVEIGAAQAAAGQVVPHEAVQEKVKHLFQTS